MNKFISKDGKKRAGVEYACKYCNSIFIARKDKLAKYCSTNCSRKDRIRLKAVNCAYCNKLVYKTPSKIKASKSGIIFCSRNCKDLAQKIGGIEAIQPGHYGTSLRRYRDIFLKAGGLLVCSRCGYKEFSCAIDIHHKDENRTNNSINNLFALCANCHRSLHNSMWKLE